MTRDSARRASRSGSTAPPSRCGAIRTTQRPPSEPAPLVGYGFAIASASLFAWLGPLSRWAYDGGMEPLAFVAWRAGIGGLTMAAFVALTPGGATKVLKLRELPAPQLAALGLAASMALLFNLALFAAFARVTIAVALIAFYTYPGMVAIVAILLGREQPSRAVLASLALALGGMVAVVGGSLDSATSLRADGSGILLALAAAAIQTIYVTISRHGFRDVPSDQATTVILGATVLGCAAIAVLSGGGAALAVPLNRNDLIPIVLLAGALGAALPSLFFLSAIRAIGGTKAGIVMLLEPVIAVGLAAWLLGETLRPVQLAGAAAVLTAGLLVQRSGRGVGLDEPQAVAAHETAPDTPLRR